MPKELYGDKKSTPKFSIPLWVDALNTSLARTTGDMAELPRLKEIANAFGKVNKAIQNDLLRLEMMGIEPTPENAIIPYHPEPKPE